jgi:hypothetical protein
MYLSKNFLCLLKKGSSGSLLAVTSGRASEELLFGFRQEQKIYFLNNELKMALKPTQPPNQCVRGAGLGEAISSVKRAGCEVE